jgi:hypothetical protein
MHPMPPCTPPRSWRFCHRAEFAADGARDKPSLGDSQAFDPLIGDASEPITLGVLALEDAAGSQGCR